nr:ankyrin repeat protein [Oriental turtle dovepox virus]
MLFFNLLTTRSNRSFLFKPIFIYRSIYHHSISEIRFY